MHTQTIDVYQYTDTPLTCLAREQISVELRLRWSTHLDYRLTSLIELARAWYLETSFALAAGHEVRWPTLHDLAAQLHVQVRTLRSWFALPYAEWFLELQPTDTGDLILLVAADNPDLPEERTQYQDDSAEPPMCSFEDEASSAIFAEQPGNAIFAEQVGCAVFAYPTDLSTNEQPVQFSHTPPAIFAASGSANVAGPFSGEQAASAIFASHVYTRGSSDLHPLGELSYTEEDDHDHPSSGFYPSGTTRSDPPPHESNTTAHEDVPACDGDAAVAALLRAISPTFGAFGFDLAIFGIDHPEQFLRTIAQNLAESPGLTPKKARDAVSAVYKRCRTKLLADGIHTSKTGYLMRSFRGEVGLPAMSFPIAA